MQIKRFEIGPIQTNCYVVYDSETLEGVLIDPAVFEKEIADFIHSNKINIRYTVNTHGHYDHIAGNKTFGYPVLIHEKDAECLKNPMRSLSIVAGQLIPVVKPQRLLVDGDEISVRGITFKVIHTPGHTPGGISLATDGHLFTGDTLFCDGVGRTDLPYSSPADLEKSIKKLMAYPDDTNIYPGHGPASTIGSERVNHFLDEGPETGE